MLTNKIKICHIATADLAVKFLLMPQLKFLMQQGYDVYVVCSPGKWLEDIKKEGIKVKPIKILRKISPFSDLIVTLKLFFYFKKEKFEIVHTHNPKPGLLGQLAAKLAGVPIIINTIHGLYFNDKSSFIKRNFFIFMEKIAARCSTLIFSQNKEDIITLIKEKISNPEKIKYLGNGVDVKKFNSERFSADFVLNKKRELSIDPNLIIIGTVGRLVKEKGYLDLFLAFKKVLEKFPKTLLLVVGPEELGKKDSFSPDIVKDYGIGENVKFLGERTDVDELYSVMNVFVLASHREGFPRSVIEAMAMRKPVIATNIRGCREEIDNGKNGILVQPENHEELVNAILLLIDNKQKPFELAEQAQNKARNEFDETLVFDRIKECYSVLLGTKKIMNRGSRLLKRMFDLFFSVFGLIITSPLFAIVALFIKLDSPGPVFFRQERVGKNGKIFKIWKFRTMFFSKHDLPVEKARNLEKTGETDPRITKIGSFLRRSGIDELPQLINIFKGEISFVGPRPLYLPRYDLNPELKVRLIIKPGMTSTNVISGGVKLSEAEILELDLKYIKEQNFWLDLEIIFKTIFLYISKLWQKKDSEIGKSPQ